MAFRSGTEFLLEIGTGTGPIVYTVVAGINSTSVTLNHEAIDVTNIASGGWKEMLDGVGLRSMEVKGSGFANTGAQLTALQTAWINGDLTPFKIIMGDTGTPDLTFTGAFRISSFEMGSKMGDAVSLSIGLSSSGAVTIT